MAGNSITEIGTPEGQFRSGEYAFDGLERLEPELKHRALTLAALHKLDFRHFLDLHRQNKVGLAHGIFESQTAMPFVARLRLLRDCSYRDNQNHQGGNKRFHKGSVAAASLV